MSIKINELIQAIIGRFSSAPTVTPIKPTQDDCNQYDKIDEILKDQEELIAYTKRAFGGGKIDCDTLNFENLFYQVIRNYTAYCYSLPASEGYHHSRKNGLITHSLQVANRSLRQAKNQFLPSVERLDVERKRTGRYYYAAWLCGLLHDAGKIYTDIIVHDAAIRANEWKPLVESFITWMERTNVSEYRVIWRNNRLHKKHDNVSINILQHVLTPAARMYISDCPDDLLSEITDALSGYQHRNGFIHSAVRIADTISTAQDIKVIWDEQLGPRQAALHEKIIKAMIELCGGWIAKGDLLALQDEVYLRWPQCIEDVIKKLVEHDSSIPHQSGTLLKTMMDRGMVKGLLNEQYSMYYPNILTDEDALNVLLGESIKGGKGFIRLEWAFHALGERPLPKNSNGLLKITPEGDAILFTDGKSRIFTAAEIEELSPKENIDSDDESNTSSTNKDKKNQPVASSSESPTNNDKNSSNTTNTTPTKSKSPTTDKQNTSGASTKSTGKTKKRKIKPKPLASNPLIDAAKQADTFSNVKTTIKNDEPSSPSPECQPHKEAEKTPEKQASWVNTKKEPGKAEELITTLLENNCFSLVGTMYKLHVGDKFNEISSSHNNCLDTLIASKYITPKSKIAHMMFDIDAGRKYIPVSKELNSYLHSINQVDTAKPPVVSDAKPPTNKNKPAQVIKSNPDEKKSQNSKKINTSGSTNSNTLILKNLLIKSLLDRGVNSPLLEQEDQIMSALDVLELGKTAFVEDGKLQLSFQELYTKNVDPTLRIEICKGALRTLERGDDDATYVEY